MGAGTSLRELLYLKALEAAGVGVWEWDMASNELEWSAEHYNLFGHAPFSFTPNYEWWEAHVHPEDLPAVRNSIRGALELGTDYDVHYRVLLPDASYRWILGRGKAEYSDSGEPIRMSGTVMDVTAQQAKARENEQSFLTYRLALEAGNLGVFQYDAKADHLDWSESHFKIFGYQSRFAPKEHHWTDRIHPEDRGVVQEQYQQLIGKIPELRMEYRIVWPDGSVHWIENRTHCHVDEDGSPIRIFGVAIDITERKIAERDRQQIQQKMELALEAGRMAVFEYDHNTNAVYWSDENYSMFGYSRKVKPCFKAWWDRVHPEDRERVHQNNLDAMTRRIPVVIEYRVVWPDGSVHWIESRAKFEYHPDGKPKQLYGVTIDVDERKKLEAIVNASWERFRNLADMSPIMVYEIDEKFETIYLNPKWCEFTGLPAEASLGRKWEQLIHPEDLPSLLTPESFTNSLVPFRREYRLKRHDGQYRWCVSEATPKVSKDGVFLGRIGTLYDIHDAKVAQEELENRVQARTEELMAANKEMEGFTYTVAHDLRTPLRAITSNSRILLEDYLDQLPDDAQLMLHRQADAATRMGMLIDDLLQYSRIGRGDLQRVPCDLGEIADAAMQDALVDQMVELEFAKVGDLRAICDPRLMQMVLTNLFSNSVKFRSPDRTLCISLSVDEHWSERRFVAADNGVGFDQQYVDKIFQPFERLVRNEDYPGTGIGLANVARIIRRHGGRIWAEGKLGEGATFTFTLP